MTKMEIACKTVGWLILLTVVIFGAIGLKGCLEEWHDETEARQVRRDAYYARFPKSGDRIELDGVEIVILKKYFWARHIRYEVRLPNGEITEVMGSEIIDKKPIEPVPE